MASPTCPEMEVSCRTAYDHRGCRCDTCTGHNRERQRAYRAKNPERVKAYQKAYNQRHEAKERRRNRQRWARRGTAVIERRYGMPKGAYNRMLEKQNGVCAICKQPETRKRLGRPMRLVVDHCHDTGEVRWLLCHNCNAVLGFAKDDPAVLRRAASMLEARGHPSSTGPSNSRSEAA